jgi:hypothetical protein
MDIEEEKPKRYGIGRGKGKQFLQMTGEEKSEEYHPEKLKQTGGKVGPSTASRKTTSVPIKEAKVSF